MTLPSAIRSVVGVTLMFGAILAFPANAPELRILATDPAPDVLLARAQPFFVRFEVTSAAESAVSVSGRFQGAAVVDNGGVSAPARLPAGGGNGVASIFYWGENPARIDEVRLQILDPHSGATITEYAFPVALTWLTDDPPRRAPAAWVREWQQAQAARTNGPAAESAPGNGVWLALGAGGLIVALARVGLRRRARPDDDARHR